MCEPSRYWGLYPSRSEPFVDRGDMDGGFVAHGELVVASGHRPLTFEPVDATFHRVALLVVLGVEGWWTVTLRPLALRCASWSILLGMVARIPRRRRCSRLALHVYALSASTRSGRVRGRPPANRGTRIPAGTATNCGLSPRWPAVSTIDNGFWPCSQPRCSFVVHPPRDRPNA